MSAMHAIRNVDFRLSIIATLLSVPDEGFIRVLVCSHDEEKVKANK